MFENGADAGTFDRLAEVRCPVTVAAGGDGAWPAEVAPLIADALPHGTPRTAPPADALRTDGGPGRHRRRGRPVLAWVIAPREVPVTVTPRAYSRGMAFPVPRSLSPSKVSSFTDCALAFRFSVIDRLPEPPSPAATRGTLVHAALERLHLLPPAERTLDAALACLADATVELRDDPEYVGSRARRRRRGRVRRRGRAAGAQLLPPGGPTHRASHRPRADARGRGRRPPLGGIIDRLELDADGGLVVTDYKTGAAPSTQYERKRLAGVHIYSLLCEQLLGTATDARCSCCTCRAAGHHRRAQRALDPRHPAHARRRLAGGRARLRARGLPARSPPGCAMVLLPAYCPAFGGDPAEAPGERWPSAHGGRRRSRRPALELA